MEGRRWQEGSEDRLGAGEGSQGGGRIAHNCCAPPGGPAFHTHMMQPSQQAHEVGACVTPCHQQRKEGSGRFRTKGARVPASWQLCRVPPPRCPLQGQGP